MTKNVSSLVAKLAQHQTEIEKLNADMARCEGIVSAASIHDAGIDVLKAKRKEELANALIDQRTAETSAFDLDITKLQKISAKALVERDAASSAIAILEGRIEVLNGQIADIRDQLDSAAAKDIMERHDSAQERYFGAVESLRSAVEEMVASEKIWRHVVRPVHGVAFPGRGAAVLDDIRAGGLRVSWEHSRLRDPAVSAEYLPGFESSYFVPWWADERNDEFASAQVTDGVSDFRAAGFPCAPYIVEQSPSAEARVVIEVLRGSVENADFKIDAATGKQVRVANNVFGAGATVAIGATDAARLVSSGLAKYVDGRSQATAFRLLNPSSPLPARIGEEQISAPRSQDEKPKVSVRYRGYADGEIPESVNRHTPGLVSSSSR